MLPQICYPVNPAASGNLGNQKCFGSALKIRLKPDERLCLPMFPVTLPGAISQIFSALRLGNIPSPGTCGYIISNHERVLGQGLK
jgi:hypothetical protein